MAGAWVRIVMLWEQPSLPARRRWKLDLWPRVVVDRAGCSCRCALVHSRTPLLPKHFILTRSPPLGQADCSLEKACDDKDYWEWY